MNPIEVLTRYPQTAMSLPQGIFKQKQSNPRIQTALDMAMQISTPLMVGRLATKEAKMSHFIAGQILNEAESSTPTKAMEALGLARKYLEPAGKTFGIGKKQMDKLTPYEVYDKLGKIIRKSNKKLP